MRKVFFFTIFLLTFRDSSIADDFDLPKLRKMAEPHVFLIQTFDSARKRQSSGTGFFVIGPRGPVGITNAHVVEGADRVECTLSDGRKIDSPGVTAFSKDLDIAALTISQTPNDALAIETAESIAGESVAVLGNPLEFGDTLTSGIVSALRNKEDGTPAYIQIHCCPK